MCTAHTLDPALSAALTASTRPCCGPPAQPRCTHPPSQSANVAYKYGVSGPFWYAAGATIQVLLFAVLAVEIKRKVRGCRNLCSNDPGQR